MEKNKNRKNEKESTSVPDRVLIRYEMLLFLEINFSLMVSIEGGQINEMDEAIKALRRPAIKVLHG